MPINRNEIIWDTPSAINPAEIIWDEEELQDGDVGDITDRGDSLADTALSFIEPAATMITGAIAEPIAGIAGLATLPVTGLPEGTGADVVSKVREALTYQPRSEAGKEALASVGETLAPVGEFIEGAERFLGDATLKATGSPTLAAAAATIPTAAMELIGLKGVGRLAKGSKQAGPNAKDIEKAIAQSVPDPEQLKSISRGVYKELDDSGVRLKKGSYSALVDKIRKETSKAGLDARVTPKAAGALEVLKDTLGESPTLTEIDTLRKVAQGVAKNMDRTEASLGNIMIREIDDFLDNVKPTSLTTGKATPSTALQAGKKYRAARNLWGRARKAELLEEAIEKAKTRASGFENGMRIELDKIANNKKLSKFFSKDEVSMMRDISKGNKAQNISKLIGRFGFSEGRATNVLSALSGVGGGAVLGGGLGAFAVPVIGTVSRQIAQGLTKGRVKFLESIVKAGSDGEKITKAYLTSVPKAQRSAAQLSELLSDPSVDLSALTRSADRIVREAAEIANGRQMIGMAAGTLAAGASIPEEQ